jgi:hypothetical protein
MKNLIKNYFSTNYPFPTSEKIGIDTKSLLGKIQYCISVAPVSVGLLSTAATFTAIEALCPSLNPMTFAFRDLPIETQQSILFGTVNFMRVVGTCLIPIEPYLQGKSLIEGIKIENEIRQEKATEEAAAQKIKSIKDLASKAEKYKLDGDNRYELTKSEFMKQLTLETINTALPTLKKDREKNSDIITRAEIYIRESENKNPAIEM